MSLWNAPSCGFGGFEPVAENGSNKPILLDQSRTKTTPGGLIQVKVHSREAGIETGYEDP